MSHPYAANREQTPPSDRVPFYTLLAHPHVKVHHYCCTWVNSDAESSRQGKQIVQSRGKNINKCFHLWFFFIILRARVLQRRYSVMHDTAPAIEMALTFMSNFMVEKKKSLGN